MRDLLSELLRSAAAGKALVHCLLVETRGSTPQKPGAAMLVYADGRQAGTLGGGCVEAEVRQRALQAIGRPGPELLTFHLDSDYGWDDGLICGGRMTIVAQPCGPAATPHVHGYFGRMFELADGGRGGLESIVLTARGGLAAGTRFLFDERHDLVAALHAPPTAFAAEVPAEARVRRPRPLAREGIAWLPILPRITLLIVGGGHVGQAVARMAAEADFRVCVLDDREQYANHSRFPAAERIIVGDIGVELQRLRDAGFLGTSCYAIIVTRGHQHDEEALYHLASADLGYLGMIGSRRKIRLIFDDLKARQVPEEKLARVHAPLGLDIGSQTVAEIAISIVAELIAHRNLGGAPRTGRRPTDAADGGT